MYLLLMPMTIETGTVKTMKKKMVTKKKYWNGSRLILFDNKLFQNTSVQTET